MPSSILCTHHKCGSSWLEQILEGHCAASGLKLFKTHLSRTPPPQEEPVDVIFFRNSDSRALYEKYRALLDRFYPEVGQALGVA